MSDVVQTVRVSCTRCQDWAWGLDACVPDCNCREIQDKLKKTAAKLHKVDLYDGGVPISEKLKKLPGFRP